MENLRVVVLSDVSPRLLWRLSQRVHKEAAGVKVCGIIHAFVPHRREHLGRRVKRFLALVANWLLHWAHACPANPNGPEFTREKLMESGRRVGFPVAFADSGNHKSAQALMESLQPDLCVALVTDSSSDLLRIPKRGSIVVSRWSGPIENVIEISVSHVPKTGSARLLRTISLPPEPLDTTRSVELKTNLIGCDLLIENAGAKPVTSTSQLLSYLSYFERRKTDSNPAAAAALDFRPFWKLFFNSLLTAPFLVVRNWYRRARGRFPVTVLVHHLISDTPHHLGMPTEMFSDAVEYLRKHYRIVSLSEAVELLETDRVDRPTVALTFDDGYQQNFLTLRSVVEATDIPVALFVCTGLVDAEAEFPHDQIKGYHNFNSLTWWQVEYLAKNHMEIGSHTRTHFDCGSDDRLALDQEIAGSKMDLDRHLTDPSRFFGFPFGNPENIHAAAMQFARSNYECVLSCFGGENLAGPGRQAHLLRKDLPNGLWALELSLQGVLDLRKILKRRIGVGEEAHKIARVHATTTVETTI